MELGTNHRALRSALVIVTLFESSGVPKLLENLSYALLSLFFPTSATLLADLEPLKTTPFCSCS